MDELSGSQLLVREAGDGCARPLQCSPRQHRVSKTQPKQDQTRVEDR
jgi:hypothetical protein